jgi:signal transduction histidine kinase
MRKSQLYSIAFGFSLLVLLSFSILLYNSLSSYSEYSSLVEHTQVIMNNLQKVHSTVVDAETGQSGFLLTKDSSFLEPLLLARGELPIILDSLKGLTSDNQIQTNRIDTLKAVIWDRLHIMEEIINRAPLLSAETLTGRLKLGKARMDDFRRVINGIMTEERNLLTIRAQKKLEFERITPSYFKAIISITAVVSLLSFILLMQELKQRTAAQNLLETRFHALNRSNAELQQIAYVTSHDIQEPLRKIRTFSDALVIKYQDQVSEEVLTILKRIDANAFRVRELVSDLSAFTSLSNPDGKITAANLSSVLSHVQEDLSDEILNKKATINFTALPTIQGYHKQLNMLFSELIINSLKFSKSGIDPVITITSSNVPGNKNELLNSSKDYLVVTIADNGIGFEKEYSNKIFILFQKLHDHNDNYEGKGLGLSLCQRIMANHEGFITASGESGIGATFNLYFPLS